MIDFKKLAYHFAFFPRPVVHLPCVPPHFVYTSFAALSHVSLLLITDLFLLVGQAAGADFFDRKLS